MVSLERQDRPRTYKMNFKRALLYSTLLLSNLSTQSPVETNSEVGMITSIPVVNYYDDPRNEIELELELQFTSIKEEYQIAEPLEKRASKKSKNAKTTKSKNAKTTKSKNAKTTKIKTTKIKTTKIKTTKRKTTKYVNSTSKNDGAAFRPFYDSKSVWCFGSVESLMGLLGLAIFAFIL